MIAELNRETRKLIVSQKQVLGQADFDAYVKQLKIGQKIDAIISHITSFGLFVNLPIKVKSGEETFLDGRIHISEVAWEKVTDLAGMFTVGESIEAIITGIDIAGKRIDLSIKRLTVDPYEEELKKIVIDQKVTGEVTKITETGVSVILSGKDSEVEGFIRKESIPPTQTYAVGQHVTMTVSDIDIKRHRVYLSPILLDKPLMYR
jgi:small subunit ribosomal protein S1